MRMKSLEYEKTSKNSWKEKKTYATLSHTIHKFNYLFLLLWPHPGLFTRVPLPWQIHFFFFFLVVQKSPLNFSTLYYCSTFLVAQMAKNLPAMWETWVQCLGRIDPLRREWLPTLVFLPGEFHGQRSLVGYGPWGHKELDMAEWLTLSHSLLFQHGYLENCSTCAQLWSW